jgi:hypothetical protein
LRPSESGARDGAQQGEERPAGLVAPLAVILAFVVGLGSLPGILLLAVAAIMALTAVVGMCPLYSVLGISTQRHAHG